MQTKIEFNLNKYEKLWVTYEEIPEKSISYTYKNKYQNLFYISSYKVLYDILGDYSIHIFYNPIKKGQIAEIRNGDDKYIFKVDNYSAWGLWKIGNVSDLNLFICVGKEVDKRFLENSI